MDVDCVAQIGGRMRVTRPTRPGGLAGWRRQWRRQRRRSRVRWGMRAGRCQSCRQLGGVVMPRAGVHGEPWGRPGSWWPRAARRSVQRCPGGRGPSCGGGGRGDARRSAARASTSPFALGRLSRARTDLLRVPAGRWRSLRLGGRPGARRWGRKPRPG